MRTRIASKSAGLQKKRIFLLLFISFAFVALFALSNVPVVNAQDSPKASSALLSKAQATGSVRIIVKLNTAFQPDGLLSRPQAIGQQ